jgi:hypothetical protein
MRLPSSSIVRILKSIPIVVMNDGVHASSQKRRRRQDLPTPGKAVSRDREERGKRETRVANEEELQGHSVSGQEGRGGEECELP